TVEATTSEDIMLDSKPVAVSLTNEQSEVVNAAIDSRQLVLGGAGTGKTHVLIQRIRHLIDTDDAAPGSEILVLRFTRAVVRDLVGVRAEMVLELLRHLHGFTVLGDPAQAIYDYQVRDERTATTSSDFLRALTESYRDISTVVLEEDFRSNHSLSEAVAQVGA